MDSRYVQIWWDALIFVACFNLIEWFYTYRRYRQLPELHQWRRWQVSLSAIYVAGCAFRSFFPRVDIERICLVDSWISSVFLGRTVATVAELCFVAQWAVLLAEYSQGGRPKSVRICSLLLVPLIAVAEVFSWYAVLTKNFFGHAVEESIWAASGVLMAGSLIALWPRFSGLARRIVTVAIAFCLAYVLFMVCVDVPMYLHRWHLGGEHLTIAAGVRDALFHREPTIEWKDWREEIPWMSLYFSLAVWISLAMVFAPRLKPLESQT